MTHTNNVVVVEPDQLREIYIIAHDIRSLYNVGSLFRLCDGVGVKKLYLTGITGAPFNRVKYLRQRQQIAKTALEGLEAVDWEYCQDPYLIISRLKSQNIPIYALEQSPSSVVFSSLQYPSRLAVILGNEAVGMDQELLAESQVQVELPMYGKGKSLNVISAASALLYFIQHS